MDATRFRKVGAYILNRLSERSTWLGLVGLAVAAGWSLTPEQLDRIVNLGLMATSTIMVLTRDPAEKKDAG